MQVTTRETAGTVIIAPDSVLEIDVGNSEEFKGLVLEAIGNNPRVILDASPIGFFDSAGMGALLSFKKKARENGGDLIVAGLRPAIHEIFQMIGFDTVFTIFPDTAAAIRELEGGDS